MDPLQKKEDDRASRILFLTNEMHAGIDSLYENLVDRDGEQATTDANSLITQLKIVLKSIDKDEF